MIGYYVTINSVIICFAADEFEWDEQAIKRTMSLVVFC